MIVVVPGETAAVSRRSHELKRLTFQVGGKAPSRSKVYGTTVVCAEVVTGFIQPEPDDCCNWLRCPLHSEMCRFARLDYGGG